MKKMNSLQLRTGDYIILLVVSIVVCVLLFLIQESPRGCWVHITVNGHKTTYLLSENQTITLDKDKGGDNFSKNTAIMNQIVIDDNTVFMKQANCPDQVCVNHKAISKNGEMIICLPNKVYIEVEGDVKNGVDN